ncbi:hypothetical protein [Streptomyces sp. A5-4]|uniref:hypothetical protein n=1 Tax=Streptomyces sp. A5-4 TaxID=3384771 RepID=UPI003DA82C0F
MGDAKHQAVQRDEGRKWIVAGLGVAAVSYLAIAAAVGFTMGRRFIDNALVAGCYGVFVTGVNLLPLLAWKDRPSGLDGRRRPPKARLTMWLVGAYVALHGVLYSRDRGADGSSVTLGFFWAAACFAGMTCMYFLGQQLWGRDAEAVDGMEETVSGS